jgi:hypothetical protein
LAATAALLLTACGSGDGSSKSNDKIAGADAGDTATSTSPSASASGSADRPKITFPEGVENKFEGWKTGDPAGDAVLSDVTQTVNAVDDAILRGDTNSATFAHYRQGKALVSAQKWVQAWLNEDLTWTGSTRYFNPKVKIADSDTAAVVYCADESKAYNKNRKTGNQAGVPQAGAGHQGRCDVPGLGRVRHQRRQHHQLALRHAESGTSAPPATARTNSGPPSPGKSTGPAPAAQAAPSRTARTCDRTAKGAKHLTSDRGGRGYQSASLDGRSHFASSWA